MVIIFMCLIIRSTFAGLPPPNRMPDDIMSLSRGISQISGCESQELMNEQGKYFCVILILVPILELICLSHSRFVLFSELSLRVNSPLLLALLKTMYVGTTATITGTRQSFDVLVGCRQGGQESPVCFNYYFDFCSNVCVAEIDKRFPDGFGFSFEYEIPLINVYEQKRTCS